VRSPAVEAPMIATFLLMMVICYPLRIAQSA